MQLVLIVNILPIFKGREQELKAHLSIEKYEREIATHNSILFSNNNCMSH